MKDLLEKKDDSIIQLDINEFLNRQKYICEKFKNPYMDDPNEIAQVLAERTHSQVVQVIGKKIVLYKENKDHKKIELPK